LVKILVIYSTVDGLTRKICVHLQQLLAQLNHEVILSSFNDAKQIKLEQFDKIVMGASIRYGKHRQNVQNFIEMNQQYLDSKPSVFFSVNLVARKADTVNNMALRHEMPNCFSRLIFQKVGFLKYRHSIMMIRKSASDRWLTL